MQFDFLICSERSGSNLITKLIDAHPEVCGPFPSHLIRCFVPQIYRYGDLSKDSNWQILIEDVAYYLSNMQSTWKTKLEAEEISQLVHIRQFGDIFRVIYEKEAAAAGKTRVFVKENHAYNFISFINYSFNESRFLWVVRDPRDMALTWKENASAPGGVDQGAAVWKLDQSEMIKQYGYLKNMDKVKLITFERLLSNTERTLQEVCQFFAIEYSPLMLDYHKKDIVRENSGKLSSWSDIGKPLIKDNYNLYKSHLSETEIRYIEKLCREEMAFLGYDFEYDDKISIEELKAGLPAMEGMFSDSDKAGNPSYAAMHTPENEQEIFKRVSMAMDRILSRKLYL